MASIIIDRRKNTRGKSTPNRRRYVRRVKEHVREAVKDVIKDGSVKDIIDEKGKKVKIPTKGLDQPTFHHDMVGGKNNRVLPGNKHYNEGDRVNRPPKGGGQGGGGKDASNDGDGEDEFEFHLTKDEFLDMFFEDLELPDLVKKDMAKVDEWVNKRAGFSVDGDPARLNVVRSMKQSKNRLAALRGPKKKKLKKLESLLENLKQQTPRDQQKIDDLEEEIRILKKKIKAVPFIDEIDLRYNRWEKQPIPATQAVMFAIMDVSASMGDWEKEMAKRFFMLLYLFLFRNYERVDIVWIRHTHTASEVDEEEFFYSRETGGTIVSTSLELVDEIIKDRYNPEQWNIFISQASDGDNWGKDSMLCQEILNNRLLRVTQYFAYVEIVRSAARTSDLWPYYEQIMNANENFQMMKITDVAEIYPVFQKLFEKRSRAA